MSEWSKETPTEPGYYWLLQAGYKQELASFGHPPLVHLVHVPIDGDRAAYEEGESN